jgi:hypothetical protein
LPSTPRAKYVSSASPSPAFHRSATQLPREPRPEPPAFVRSTTVGASPVQSARRRDMFASASTKLKLPVEVDSGYSSPSTPESGRSPSARTAEYIVIDAEPRYTASSSRERKLAAEPKLAFDRRERSVSPHTPRMRSVDHSIRPSLSRGASASARPSPTHTMSYVYPRGEATTLRAEPASFSRRDVSGSARFATTVVSPTPRGVSSGLGSGDGRVKYAQPLRQYEVSFSPRITPESVHYSDVRVS